MVPVEANGVCDITMNCRKLLILIFAGLIGSGVSAQNRNDSVFKRAILSALYVTSVSNNKKVLLKESPKPLYLFIFLSPECPLCRRYSTAFKNLFSRFNQKVEFFGIVPGNAYTVAEVRKYVDEHHIPFSLFIDQDKMLSNYLQATTTPQVILLNENYQMVYKGAVDNLLSELGKPRLKATEDYLNKAISQSLEHEVVSVKRTKAVGCRINDY